MLRVRTSDAVRQAEHTPEVTAAVGLLKSSVLAPAAGCRESATAQGVAGTVRDLAAVQDLDVKHGRLALGRGEIAVDALAGIVLGTGIAPATLVPMTKRLTGQGP
ncbi:hypothetical protein [Streptomyces sp. NPDC005799]|uniref:hypothetical protein n=1 Tax=Streptomyces sp. NPDC005799 TaxID=3154678 RepID=UPI0033CA818E